MTVKVMVETNFDIIGEFSKDEVELQLPSATLRVLLKELSRRWGGDSTFIDPQTGELDPIECEVLINGTAYGFLPHGMETRLKDEDNVTIIRWMEALGGG
jgi:hypothetical protein